MPSENTRRIAKNTAMLYIRMLLIMAVTLYTSRVVLNVLGVEDYGIYSVVGGVVAMFGFLNSAMSGATSRFLTYDLGKQDRVGLQKTFDTALTIHIGIAVLIFLLAETIGLWFVEHKLSFRTTGCLLHVWSISFLSQPVWSVSLRFLTMRRLSHTKGWEYMLM